MTRTKFTIIVSLSMIAVDALIAFGGWGVFGDSLLFSWGLIIGALFMPDSGDSE